MVSVMLVGYFVCLHASLAVRITSNGCSGKKALKIASRTTKGTALIVGANFGSVPNDPSWSKLASPKFDHFDKVYIEPHPGLFKQLAENVKRMPRGKAIRAAVTDVSGPMKMYCLGLDENGVLTPEAQATPGFQEWWSQICSGSRDRLMSKYDVEKNMGMNISSLVVEVNVPTITVAKLLEEVPSSVQYLQIDVEGFDDQVLMQFPFHGQSSFYALFRTTSFRPAAVVFEYVLLGNERTDAAINFLNEHGYKTCFDGQNVIGILHDV
jgi:FkbM family methyltransferase